MTSLQRKAIAEARNLLRNTITLYPLPTSSTELKGCSDEFVDKIADYNAGITKASSAVSNAAYWLDGVLEEKQS